MARRASVRAATLRGRRRGRGDEVATVLVLVEARRAALVCSASIGPAVETGRGRGATTDH